MLNIMESPKFPYLKFQNLFFFNKNQFLYVTIPEIFNSIKKVLFFNKYIILYLYNKTHILKDSTHHSY